MLGVTETCDLGSLYFRLKVAGHDVKVSISEPLAQGTMEGLVPCVDDWRDELDWIRAAGRGGVILFEAVGFGKLQDELRTAGFNVIGGSSFGDRLESDRSFALDLLKKHGMNMPTVVEFRSVKEALADLQLRQRRCVFKVCSSAGETFAGTFEDGRDVAALLRIQPPKAGQHFLLMDYVSGIETGVGAYFNGEKFLRPACLDWEHKRFFPGNMGELTGEMGTVATFQGAASLFDATLARLEPHFREGHHVGWVNLNTMINDAGVWPLELTCRFGYPGFAVLEPLQRPNWAALFEQMLSGKDASFETLPGFSVGIVLTTPPMPLSRKEVAAPVGLPVVIGDIDQSQLHLGEVGLLDDQLVTSGLYGWTAVVTGTGQTVAEARKAAYANAAHVQAPNMRYRLDIGDALIGGELTQLAQWGWLSGDEDKIAIDKWAI